MLKKSFVQKIETANNLKQFILLKQPCEKIKKPQI